MNSTAPTTSDDKLPDVTTIGGRPTPDEIVPELIDTHDAARLLGIGTRTLWRWSNSGLAPAPLKIGRGLRAAVRFRRSELLQWIADGCPRLDGKASRR